ncbi:MAG TPA: TldD/PmbA family protein [Candidatus Latescibacteria bacterium]|nr:TldD/PmbA family protein [Candidatus Latescibacterota bacterium]
MRQRLEEALRRGRADYVEVRVEEVESTAVTFKGKEIDVLSASKVRGGIVRALAKGGWGMAVFNDLGELSEAVGRACEVARLVGKEDSKLAEVEPVEEEVRVEFRGRDFRGVALDEKVRVAREYNEIMLKHHPKIETTETRYGDSFRRIWYINSEGTYIEDERPDISIYLTAIARDGDNVQRVTRRAMSHGGFETVEGLQEKAEAAAERAVELLSAPPVKGGIYTVILNPRLAGVFAHEAFGHLSEADFVYENPRMKELLVLGRRFGVEDVSIVDDGTIPGLYGSIMYDDEGVSARRSYLLKEGVLVGRLHNRETSAKMGEPLTGNARAQGYSHEPIVRMTNTYIKPGDVSFEDMLSEMKLGVYAVDVVGGQTMMEMFTFSAGWGYMIRNGKVEELVRDVVLTGNLFETLKNIEAVGNDLKWDHGHCGKGAQGAPVSTGSPHIRIRNVVVGGRR